MPCLMPQIHPSVECGVDVVGLRVFAEYKVRVQTVLRSKELAAREQFFIYLS